MIGVMKMIYILYILAVLGVIIVLPAVLSLIWFCLYFSANIFREIIDTIKEDHLD